MNKIDDKIDEEKVKKNYKNNMINELISIYKKNNFFCIKFSELEDFIIKNLK